MTSIKGSYGSYQGKSVIRSLEFGTNILLHYGPFGLPGTGTTFSFTMESGCIVAFHGGHPDNYLEAIGVYVKPKCLLRQPFTPKAKVRVFFQVGLLFHFLFHRPLLFDKF